MLLAGEGDGARDAELFCADRSGEFAGVTLPGDSFRDQVSVVRLSTRETRLSRATNVAMATRVATAARISRVRGFRAHFILLIYTAALNLAVGPVSVRRRHFPDILFKQRVAFRLADLGQH